MPGARRPRADGLHVGTAERMPTRLLSTRTGPRSGDLLAAGGGRSRSSSCRPRPTTASSSSGWRSGELEPLRPTFVSVTYGAGGRPGTARSRVTGRIAAETTLTPVGAPDRGQPLRRGAAARRRPVRGGRGPQHARAARRPAGRPERRVGRAPARGSRTPTELVRLVRESGDFCVGVAAFPEGHPRSPDLGGRHRVLRRTSAAPAPTSRSRRCSSTPRTTCGCGTGSRRPAATCRSSPGSCRSPACRDRPGAAAVRAAFPADLAERLHAAAGDKAAVREIGVEYAAGMCQRLLARGRARPALLHAERVAGDARDLPGPRTC